MLAATNTMLAQATSKYIKQKIPKALREQVWLHWMGKKFEGKCRVKWCSNTISVFDWEAGHNIPESKGGKTSLENLRPICSRCNKSMGDQYSIDEWNNLGKDKEKKCGGCCGGCCSVM
jgi:5-methylcytosine-specific restriction endonuclease McrA